MAIAGEIKNILEEYASKRAREQARVNGIYKQLFSGSTNFKKAREEYSSARAAQAMAKLKGESADIEKQRKQYYRELEYACKANDIDVSELEIKFECPDCQDTGFVGEGEKTYCHCLINKATKQILANQNLMEDATFDNFDISIFPADKKVDKEGRNQREHILYMKERAQKWCESFPGTKKLQALFVGATGVGKSYMSSCIAHEIIKKGYSVVNTKASGINEAMLKVINSRDNSVISFFKTCDLLIIDDLGAEPVLRNITVETLYDIVEHRLTSKKHTIIVTNLQPKAMEDRYGYRISSRVASTTNTALMNILGDDLRRR
ncbi:MAG: ATP-binding protein [Eubacteriales bacterium]